MAASHRPAIRTGRFLIVLLLAPLRAERKRVGESSFPNKATETSDELAGFTLPVLPRFDLLIREAATIDTVAPRPVSAGRTQPPWLALVPAARRKTRIPPLAKLTLDIETPARRPLRWSWSKTHDEDHRGCRLHA